MINNCKRKKKKCVYWENWKKLQIAALIGSITYFISNNFGILLEQTKNLLYNISEILIFTKLTMLNAEKSLKDQTI